MRPEYEAGNKEWVVVAWTHRGSPGTVAGEIIAKLYNPADASPVSSEYSLVNEVLDNNQYVSSVSARREKYIGTYFWAESTTNSLECKISPYSPGVDMLKSMVTCQEIPPVHNPEPVEGFSAFPNPSNGELTIEFENKDIEMGAVKIELIGPLGQKIPSRFDPKTGKLSPKQKTSPGIYNLRVIAGQMVYKKSVQIQ
jgi:hypothetical protein